MPIGGKRYFKSIVNECFGVCTSRELAGIRAKLRKIGEWEDTDGKLDHTTLERVACAIFQDDVVSRQDWLVFVDDMHVEFYESISSCVRIGSRRGKGPHWLSIL